MEIQILLKTIGQVTVTNADEDSTDNPSGGCSYVHIPPMAWLVWNALPKALSEQTGA